MDPLTISAASGLRARMESLEMLANNLANAATSGYKADREFYSLYFSPEALAAGGVTEPGTLPVIERQWTDFSQGPLRPTGNPFDLSIEGRGLFSVTGPAGRLYTRNGSFQLSATGVLETADGFPVRIVGGGPLQTQSSSPFEVTSDGTVQQDGQTLGQIEIVEFSDSGALLKHGSSYFRPADPSLQPAAAASFAVHQGKIEGSNAGSAEAVVKLVGVMRQFEMLQKAVQLGAEMNRRAIEEVARPGG